MEMTTDYSDTFGINPSRIYRKFARETQDILGLKRTAIEEAIENGDIPPPLPLTDHGTATGWMGITLIELQRKRLAKTEALRAEAKAKPRLTPRERRQARRTKAKQHK
jgi:hypothetical protein